MMENSWLTETLCGLMTIFAGYLKWAMMENVVELLISGSNTPGSVVVVVVVVVVVGVVVFIYFSGWDCSQLLKLESPWLSALKVIIFFGWLKHPNMAGREIPVAEMEV